PHLWLAHHLVGKAEKTGRLLSCDVDVSAAVRIKPFSQAGSSARSIHIYVRTAFVPHTPGVA
ncbi:hypothetical protein ACXY6Z_19735, partial [Sphingomonas aquatilis]